jgi:hypothetical protein
MRVLKSTICWRSYSLCLEVMPAMVPVDKIIERRAEITCNHPGN